MDAPADYATVTRLLTANIPAYVTYTVRTAVHVGVDKEQTERITVRTRDGKVVKGKRPNLVLNSGKEKSPSVNDTAFDPKCYRATGARQAKFEGHAVEELALRSTCHDEDDDDSNSSTAANHRSFTTLYVDPNSHAPIAVTGGSAGDKTVAVNLEQRFMQTGGHTVPASLYVSVKGSGFMFWLNVVVREQFSDFAFSDKAP